MERCGWTNNNPLMIEYHDKEWGMPLYDDNKLFEFMLLDAFQAGLSWSIILSKRESMRLAFDGFNINKIAAYDNAKFNELINNPGIIRNKLKVNAAITNAGEFLKIQEEFGCFSKYVWQFTDRKTIVNHWQSFKEVPARTEISDMMSKDLQKRGFKFVGSTICYAFMQAAGMVNDHFVSCFRYQEINNMTLI